MLRTYVVQQRQLLHMAHKITRPQEWLWGGRHFAACLGLHCTACLGCRCTACLGCRCTSCLGRRCTSCLGRRLTVYLAPSRLAARFRLALHRHAIQTAPSRRAAPFCHALHLHVIQTPLSRWTTPSWRQHWKYCTGHHNQLLKDIHLPSNEGSKRALFQLIQWSARGWSLHEDNVYMNKKSALHNGQGTAKTLQTIVWYKRACIRQATR